MPRDSSSFSRVDRILSPTPRARSPSSLKRIGPALSSPRINPVQGRPSTSIAVWKAWHSVFRDFAIRPSPTLLPKVKRLDFGKLALTVLIIKLVAIQKIANSISAVLELRRSGHEPWIVDSAIGGGSYAGCSRQPEAVWLVWRRRHRRHGAVPGADRVPSRPAACVPRRAERGGRRALSGPRSSHPVGVGGRRGSDVHRRGERTPAQRIFRS